VLEYLEKRILKKCRRPRVIPPTLISEGNSRKVRSNPLPFHASRQEETPVSNNTEAESARQIEIKQEPNKSGGGEGQWSAWKVSAVFSVLHLYTSTTLHSLLSVVVDCLLIVRRLRCRQISSPRSTKSKEVTTRTNLVLKTSLRRVFLSLRARRRRRRKLKESTGLTI
jgi:hypothetical protein